MKSLLTLGAAAGALVAVALTAQAGVVRTFSGSGNSGFLAPADMSEPWTYGNPSGVFPDDVGWGSPGIGQDFTPSNETLPVTDFEITFASALDPAAIGGTGTRFVSKGVNPLWTAVFDPAAPDSITFVAPSGTMLAPGQDYFVNVFLLPGDGVSGEAFSGAWTSSVVPEPASLALLGTALFGLGLIRRPRRS